MLIVRERVRNLVWLGKLLGGVHAVVLGEACDVPLLLGEAFYSVTVGDVSLGCFLVLSVDGRY